ncbi:MAG: hypothetical protein WEB93_05020, partial [Sphingomonadales bacterium]
VLIIGAVALFLNYGTAPTIKYALEREGSTMTGVPAPVGEVDLSLLGGALSLGNFRLGNPSGFKAPEAIYLGETRVNLDRRSLFSDQIVINEIVVVRPDVTFERGQGSSNLEIIKKAIDRYIPEADPEAEPINMLVKEFVIEGATLNYNLREGQTLRTLSLPDVKVENIGTGGDGGGVSVDEAVSQIVEQLTPFVLRELARIEGVEALRSIVADPGQLRELLDTDTLQDGLGGAKDLLEDGGGQILDKIPGLGKKNEAPE